MSLASQIRFRLRQTPLRRLVTYYRHLGLDGDDAFLAAYPKSGSTWLQFMLAALLTGEDVGFESATDPIPGIGDHRKADSALPTGGRLVMTHEAYRPSYRTAVHLVRDPRDVAVSYYFHHRSYGTHGSDLEDFVERFVAGRDDGHPDWGTHTRSWLLARDEADIRVVRYEDLVEETADTLRDAARHLGLDPSDDELTRAIEWNTPERMRAKEEQTTHPDLEDKDEDIPFVRKAEPGDHEEKLSPDLEARILERFEGPASELGYA